MKILRGIIRGQVEALALAVIFATMLVITPESQAQPFEVIGLGEDGGKFEQGEREFEVNLGFQDGFPSDAEEATQSASELSYGYSFSDSLKGSAGLVLTKEKRGDLTLSNVALEATWAIFPWFGAFVAIEPSTDDDSTNEFVIGPVFQIGDEDKLQFTANPFLEKTFGRNREEGVAFAYGWQAKMKYSEAIAYGVEGYGEIEDAFDNAPDFDEQVHRIGPVIYLHIGELFETGTKLELNFGVLAGITRDSPDVAIKFNAEFEF